jgi:GxxExxY protein
LTERIIGLVIEVHRHSGPGLLESLYAATLCRALERAGIRIWRKVGIPAIYKGESLQLGFRGDILADETVTLEIKGVPATARVRHTIADRFAHERSSGRPVVRLPCASSERQPLAPRLTDSLRRFIG